MNECIVCGEPTTGRVGDDPVCWDCYESGRLAAFLEKGESEPRRQYRPFQWARKVIDAKKKSDEKMALVRKLAESICSAAKMDIFFDPDGEEYQGYAAAINDLVTSADLLEKIVIDEIEPVDCPECSEIAFVVWRDEYSQYGNCILCGNNIQDSLLDVYGPMAAPHGGV